MYRNKFRFLFALLCVFLLCSAVQATNLLITVQDNIDNTSIPHATVFLNGANQGRTTNNGQFSFVHSGLNDLDLRVSMAGYDDWEQIVNRNATSLLVNLTRQSLTLKVSLYDSDSLSPIPSGIVNITSDNNTQSKLTDSTGSVTFGVNAVTLYSVYITAANYQPRSSTIDMGIVNNEVQYRLLSGNSYSFVVKDKDSGAGITDAEVRVDTILVGKTDSRGILIAPITKGKTYTIEIKKQGYQTFTESRLIGETDAIESIQISRAPVGAFIYVTDENRLPLEGADVYINGTLSGMTNQYGRKNFPDILSGSYPVEVRKTGYVGVSRLLNVSAQGLDYVFELPFESAALKVFVQEKDQKVVSNATIILNGQTAGVTDDHGQYVTSVKLNALYNITATKDGYQPTFVQKQVIQGNSTDSVTLTMEKSLDWGLITLIGIGAVCVLILFAAIRMFGRRKRRHVMRRNEI
jgi:hypothetical protein